MKGRPGARSRGGGVGLFAGTALLVLIASVAAFRIYDRPLHGVDDAQIFFVYADHLVGGHGFVYNAGGERVEGFSSLGWVLLASAAIGAFGTAERPLLILAGFLAAFGLFVLARAMRWQVRRAGLRAWRGPGGFAAIALPGMVLCSGAWLVWQVLSLMDCGLWGFLLSLGAASIVARRRLESRRAMAGLAVLGVAMVLVRPEAMLVAPAWALLQLWVGRGRRSDRRAGIPVETWLVAASLAALAVLTIWRIAYFGFPLPNTFYAKVSPSPSKSLADGVAYLRDYLLHSPLALGAASLSVAAAGFRLARVARRRGSRRVGFEDRRYLALAAFAGLLLLVPVPGGGDHFQLFRMYQPGLPALVASGFLGAVLLGRSLALGSFATKGRRASLPFLFLAIAAVAELLRGSTSWRNVAVNRLAAHEFRIASEGLRSGEIARRIFERTGSRPRIGVGMAGGFTRGYRGPVLDLLGLNDVAMGHSRGDRIGLKGHAAFDRKIFFADPPDLLMPTGGVLSADGAEATSMSATLPSAWWWDPVLKHLLSSRPFRARFAWARVIDGGSYVDAYFRRDFLEELRSGGAVRVVMPATVEVAR